MINELFTDAVGKHASRGSPCQAVTDTRLALLSTLHSTQTYTPDFVALKDVLSDVKFALCGYGLLIQRGVSRKRIPHHHVAAQVGQA